MMKKILTACLMAVLCQGASADDDGWIDGRWLEIASQSNLKLSAYIDTLRSTPNNVWIRHEYKGENDSYIYKYSIIQYLINCEENSLAKVQSADYDKAGEAIRHTHLKPYEIQYKQPIPHTIGEIIVHVACVPLAKHHCLKHQSHTPQETPLSPINRR